MPEPRELAETIQKLLDGARLEHITTCNRDSCPAEALWNDEAFRALDALQARAEAADAAERARDAAYAALRATKQNIDEAVALLEDGADSAKPTSTLAMMAGLYPEGARHREDTGPSRV